MGEKESVFLSSPYPSTLFPFPFSLFDFSFFFFSKGTFKDSFTVKPFASIVILVRSVVLIFIALLYWHNLQHTFSCTQKKKKKKIDFADAAYFIEGTSKNLTAKNTLLAGQVGFAGLAVAVKCRVGQQCSPQ